MAKVTAKCEFMDNAFPAGQLKLKGDFFVVEDTQGEHMIFSVDTRGKLCLILKGSFGRNELINLSEKLQVPQDHRISALAVSQNTNGLIHLVFTVRQPDGSDVVRVLRPMKPTLAEWSQSFDVSVDMIAGEQWGMSVREILLGTSNDSSGDATRYPQIYLVFNHSGKDTEDICALAVDVSSRTWNINRNFQMPCNPELIVDKCVANLKMYRGLFVLYKEDKSSPVAQHLRFVGLDPRKKNPVLQNIVQKLPEGAARMASFEDQDGYTDLLVSGKELTWRSAREAFTASTKPFTVLSSDPEIAGLAQIGVAQSKELLSVWCLNKEPVLSYQEYNIMSAGSPPVAKTPTIPLTNREVATDRFAALQHAAMGQKLFVIDNLGAMKMLEQDVQSGMWQPPLDIMIPESDEMIEFKSHTVQIQLAHPTSGAPLINAPLKLCCSTSVELIVNGTTIRGCAEGQLLQTDDAGSLTIIMKSDSLSTPILTLVDPDPNVRFFESGPVIVDPMSKLWSTVDGIKTGEDLKSLTLPDGSSLARPDVDDADLEKAAQALQKLSEVREELSSPSTVVPSTPDKSEEKRPSSRLWGAWYWVCEQIKKGYQWTVRKIGQAWHFVVELAGKAWSFLLESPAHIAAGMQKVLETISKGWDWVKKKFEFMFSWQDILDTKNILANFATNTLLSGVDVVAFLEVKSTEFFEDLEAKVRAFKQAKLPPELLRAKAGSIPDLDKQEKDENIEMVDETLKSPASNYGNYHMKHSSDPGSTRSKGNNPLQRLLSKFETVGTEVEKLAEHLKENFGIMFKSSEISFGDLIAKLGLDLLEDLISVIKSVVSSILQCLGEVILLVAAGLNEPIVVPILSPLYRKLTRGAELTVLDAICLRIAIPVTFVFKMLTGKRPCEIEDIGDMIKINATKPMLDARMGRSPSNGNLPIFESSVSSVSCMTVHKPVVSLAETSLGVKTIESTASAVEDPDAYTNEELQVYAYEEQEDPLEDAQPCVIGETKSTAQKASSVPNLEVQFEARQRPDTVVEHVAEVVPLISLANACASLYIWRDISFPGLFSPERKLEFNAALMKSFAYKALPWLFSWPSLGNFTFKELFSPFEALRKRANDPLFSARMCLWGLSGVPVFGSLLGKTFSNALTVVIGVMQLFVLAILYVAVYMAKKMNWWVFFEDLAKLTGKITAGIAGLSQGAEGFCLSYTTVVTSAGLISNVTRVSWGILAMSTPQHFHTGVSGDT